VLPDFGDANLIIAFHAFRAQRPASNQYCQKIKKDGKSARSEASVFMNFFFDAHRANQQVQALSIYLVSSIV
jgi:hypothetical protein